MKRYENEREIDRGKEWGKKACSQAEKERKEKGQGSRSSERETEMDPYFLVVFLQLFLLSI